MKPEFWRVPATMLLASTLNTSIDSTRGVSNMDIPTLQPVVSHEPALLTTEYPTLEERTLYLYTPKEYSKGFLMYLNGQVPVAYQHPDTEPIWFSQEEVAEFKRRIVSAKENNRMEALTSLPDPEQLTTVNSPETTDSIVLPENLMTNNELRGKNVRVINTESGVSLGIKPDAFEAGGLFEPLELLRKAGEDISLEIFMLDGPQTYYAFINSKLYPVQREFLAYVNDEPPVSNDWQAYDVREHLIFGVQERLEDLALELGLAKTPDQIESTSHSIFMQELLLKYYENIPDARVLEIRAARLGEDREHPTTGYGATADYSILYDKETLDYYNLTGRTGIFIAASANPRENITARMDILALPDGTVNAVGMAMRDWKYPVMTVEPERSFQNSEDLITNPEATEENNQKKTYPKLTEHPHIGHVLRHEIMHVWLLKWLPLLHKRGMLEQLSFYDELISIEGIEGYLGKLASDKLEPNRSEFVADTIALKTTEEAFKRMIESKFSDYSGYPLVFYTKGTDQKVQISQVQPQPAENAKAALAKANPVNKKRELHKENRFAWKQRQTVIS